MKKNMLFIAFVCCLTLQAKAQTSTEREYIPLLNSGNQWNLSWDYFGGLIKKTYITKLGSDTLVNDTNYYQLLTTKDSLASIWLNDGYIREDTQNRKVYYRLGDSLEILLYDFSAKIGDTIQSYDFRCDKGLVTIIVKDTNEVLIGGKLRKQMNVHVLSTNPENYDGYRSHIWTEGIGDMDGLLRSTEYNCPPASVQECLICFFQNEDLVYKSEYSWAQNFGGCFVWYDSWVNIEQSSKSSDISVYPNPVDNYLVVSSLNQTISLVEIFNISGHKVYSQSHGNTIDVSSFSKGIYLLKVYDKSGHVSSFKIIKK